MKPFKNFLSSEEEKLRKEEKEKTEDETRTMKKKREKTYHMCFDCRKGMLIVE